MDEFTRGDPDWPLVAEALLEEADELDVADKTGLLGDALAVIPVELLGRVDRG